VPLRLTRPARAARIAPVMRVPIILASLVVLTVLGASGCDTPCKRLARTTCDGTGDDATACKEMRTLAGRASDDDQHHCREALAVLGTLKAGTAGTPGAGGGR